MHLAEMYCHITNEREAIAGHPTAQRLGSVPLSKRHRRHQR
jgi:hypothetical protein